MNTTVTEQNGKLIAKLEGSLDTAAAEQTAQQLSPLQKCEGRDIVIDCTGLTYISSSGLRIFLSIRKNAAIVGSHVTLTGISDNIRDVLITTGFHNLFTIE
jgi:anti-sigma B factor antagonist